MVMWNARSFHFASFSWRLYLGIEPLTDTFIYGRNKECGEMVIQGYFEPPVEPPVKSFKNIWNGCYISTHLMSHEAEVHEHVGAVKVFKSSCSMIAKLPSHVCAFFEWTGWCDIAMHWFPVDYKGLIVNNSPWLHVSPWLFCHIKRNIKHSFNRNTSIICNLSCHHATKASEQSIWQLLRFQVSIGDHFALSEREPPSTWRVRIE